MVFNDMTPNKQPALDEIDKSSVLNTAGLAVMLHLSEFTVTEMARNGKIPGVCLGNRWLFVKDQVLSVLRDIATSEQNYRKEQAEASKPKPELEEKRPRGRPRKAVDLGRYGA